MNVDSFPAARRISYAGRSKGAINCFSITNLLGDVKENNSNCVPLSPDMTRACGELRLAASLVEAIEAVDIDRVMQLISAGAPVNCTTGNGWAPLHFAARKGDANICHLLCERGADPSKTTSDNQTAFDIAFSHGRAACVSVLSAFWPETYMLAEHYNNKMPSTVSAERISVASSVSDPRMTSLLRHSMDQGDFKQRARISMKSSAMSLDLESCTPPWRNSDALTNAQHTQSSHLQSSAFNLTASPEASNFPDGGCHVFRADCGETSPSRHAFMRHVQSNGRTGISVSAQQRASFPAWSDRNPSLNPTLQHHGIMKSDSEPPFGSATRTRGSGSLLVCPNEPSMEKAFNLIDAYTREATNDVKKTTGKRAKKTVEKKCATNERRESAGNLASDESHVGNGPEQSQSKCETKTTESGDKASKGNEDTSHGAGKGNEEHSRKKSSMSQDSFNWKKYGERQCAECEATETPQWRGGPGGTATLCNACGLKYFHVLNREKKNARRREKYMQQKTKRQWAKVTNTLPFASAKGGNQAYRAIPTCFS